MKRALKALIIGLCVLAFAFSGAVTALAQGSAGDAVPASETDGTSARTESLELFLPSSPEQFLPLNSPNDVAISDDYIAVADSRTSGAQTYGVIYVFDRENGTYAEYLSTENVRFSSLCFYGNILLFVPSGSETYIHYLDCSSAENGSYATATRLTDTESSPITCNSFVANGSSLYYATLVGGTVNIYSGTLSATDGTLTAQTDGISLFSQNEVSASPYFSVYNGQVYFSAENTIHTVSTAASRVFTTTYSVYAFAIVADVCYYSSTDGSHYVYKTGTGATDPQLTAFSNVIAVEEYGDQLYFAVAGSEASVKQVSTADEAYTGWEIAQYSSGARRLGSGAASLSMQGSNLIFADPANSRVLVYDTLAQTYTSVAVDDLGGSFFVCTGQEDFLVSNGSTVCLYAYGGTRLLSLDYSNFDGSVTDAAYSYGAYYLVTDTGATYRVTENGIDPQSGSLGSGTVPDAIAADIGGDLWVQVGNTAYRYTEDAFLSQNANHTGETVLLGAGVTDILIDYAGNVYGLTADRVLMNGTSDETPLGLSSFVSYADDAQAVAFAFGFETGDAYILTDSGFIVKWSYGIESLDNIAADGAYDALTGAAASDAYSGILVTVSQDAVAVLLDESAFSADMQTLPTDGYARAGSLSDSANSGKPITGVRAFDILGVGTVVALYEYVPGQTEAGSDYVPTQRNYTLCLVLEGGLQSVEQDSYYTAETSVGYTTNAVGLYNLPLMRTGSAAYRLELPKGTQVTVLGRISCAASAEGGWGLDADYCFISCTVDGQTVYGFLPAPYVSAAPPAGTAGSGTEDITFRYLKQQQITLSDGETLTILGAADEEGNVYATYEYRGVTYGGKVALSLLGEESVSGENTTRPLLEGSSVTLYNTERLTVYGGPDENGLVRVSYTLNGRNYTALISEDLLADASDFGTWVLVAVTIVTAAVLASACYLVLRKPPMITPPLSAEEAESGADGDGADGEADGADRPAEERERPSDDGEEE